MNPTTTEQLRHGAAHGARLIDLVLTTDVSPEQARHLLDDAVEVLRGVVTASDPRDPDLVLPLRDLGCALGLRVELGGGAADHAEAIERTRRAWRSGPHPGIDRVALAVDLGLLIVRHGADDEHEVPPDATARELEAEAVHGGDDPAARAVLDLYAGMVRLHDCDTDDPGSITACLDRVSAVLPRVPDDLPLLDEILHTVAEGCVLVERVDLGTAAVERLRGLPGSEVDPVDVDLADAGVVDARMWRDEDADALDRVVDLLRGAHRARPGDRVLAAWLAERLVLRADLREDPSGIADAISLLGDPSGLPPGERAEVCQRLGTAYFVRWTQRGADDDRDLADRFLHAGTEAGPLGLHDLERRLQLVEDRARRSPDPTVWPLAEELISTAVDAMDGPEARADPRARAATALAAAALELQLSGEGEIHIDRLRQLADAADEHPTPPPEWHTRVGLVRSMIVVHDDVIAGHGDHGRAVLEDVLARSEYPEEIGPVLAPMFGLSALSESMVSSGDLTSMRSAARLVGDTGPAGAGLARAADLVAGVMGSVDAADLRTRLAEAAAGLDDEPSGGDTDRLRAMVGWMSRALDGGHALPGEASLPTSVPGTGAYADAMNAGLRTMAVMERARTEPGSPGLRAELVELAALAGSASARDNPGVGAMSAMALGTGWSARARAVPSDREALDHAVHWSAAAVAALPGVEHPTWTQFTSAAADAARLRDAPGDRASARRFAAEALRGRTWLVLRQSSAAEARHIARTAAAAALALARRCADDRAHDELVAALEAGRGLVLHAALTSRGLAGRLRAAGRPDLAEEWDRSGGGDLLESRVPALAGSGLPGDLRRRVLEALAGDRAGLLDPPGLPEIRAALQAHGSDALVYLVPGDAAEPGLVVVVPATAEVQVLTLSGLRDLPGGPLDRYAHAYRAAHAGGRGDPEVAAWRRAMEDLTAWAWDSAVDRLLAVVRVDAADPARPSLVLVPVGRSALVPWHAAAPPGAGPDRALVAHAVVSSTPSARLLCRAVARPRASAGTTLVLGDPTGDLSAARREAHHLHRTLYPDGEYLGRGGLGVRPAGTGSRADLLDRLTGDRGHSVVHLACHGHAEPAEPARSALVLADGDLTLGDLMEHRPTASFPLDTVVLAACSTNVGGIEYDEAYSVATAFLAVGARSAIGSLWAVPDDRTSDLMIRLHHHLRVDGIPPAEALHRARLAALVRPEPSPATRTPAGADGSRPGGKPVPGPDPLAWAGFVHLGA